MDIGEERQGLDGDQSGTPVPESEIVPVTRMTDSGTISIVDADIVPEPPQPLSEKVHTDGTFRRPGFWPAVLWTLLLMVSQIVVGLGIVVLAVISVISRHGGMPNPNRFPDLLMEEMKDWMLPVASFATMVITFALVLILFRKQTARCMGLRGLTIAQSVIILLLALPMSVLTSEFTNCISHLLPHMPMSDIFGDFATQSWPLVFAAGCLFPGVGEELFFRGFLSRGLVSRHGVYWGTLSAAFLFGAIHIHPIQGTGAFMIGIVLQFVFLATRSLWGAVLLHTANNTLAFGAMKYAKSFPIAGFTTESQKNAILHTPVLLVLAALVTSAVLLLALYRIRTEWRSADGSAWSHGFVSVEGPLAHDVAQPVSKPPELWEIGSVLLVCAAFAAALVHSVEA